MKIIFKWGEDWAYILFAIPCLFGIFSSSEAVEYSSKIVAGVLLLLIVILWFVNSRYRWCKHCDCETVKLISNTEVNVEDRYLCPSCKRIYISIL